MAKGTNELKLIDAPVYGYWSALWKSFYSRRLYVDIGKRWKGYGLVYLLLVIAILSIPFFLKMTISFNQAFKEQIVEPLLKMPLFYVQNGNVVFDKPMPYLIDNDKKQTLIIIDTTGVVNDFNDKYPYLTILINKDKMSFRLPAPQLFTMGEQAPVNKSQPMVQPFAKEDNLVFDGKKFAEQNSITVLKLSSQLMLYPVIVAIFFSIFMVFFLVLSFLGQTFSTIFFSFKISFAASCRLLIVAGTPMLLLFFLIMTSHRLFQGLGFILFFTLTAYYAFALHVLRAESRQIVAP